MQNDVNYLITYMMMLNACFRAIFLWLCSKDLSKLKFPNPERGSPEEILMNLQQGYTTYARVYEMLCRLHRLSCHLLPLERLYFWEYWS